MKKYIFFILCSLFIPIWIFIISPQILKLPKNFEYTAKLVSIDNKYNEETRQFQGEKYSNTLFSYSTIASKGDVRTIKNTFDVRTIEGEPIFKAEPIYGVNAVTRKHVKEAGDMKREGFLFAPTNLSKEDTFDYWHVSNNYPSHMKFVVEENIYGLQVLKFEKTNTEAIDQSSFFSDELKGSSQKGIKLSSSLTLWIEPITGHLIKFDESSLDYYFFDKLSGEKLVPYNKFSNRFSEESILEQVRLAQKEKLIHYIVVYSIPVLIVLILIFVLLNEMMIVRTMYKILRLKFIAIFISLFVFILSIISFFLIKAEYDLIVQERYKVESNQVIELVKNRVNIYQNALLSANALFTASVEVSRNEWDIFIENLLLIENYPGIQSIGFAPRVREDEKTAFIAHTQQNVYANFSIFPPGQREAYIPTIFVNPANELNRRRLGFDLSTDSVRNHAIKRSLELNKPVISGKIIYDDVELGGTRSGFGMYFPVLRKEYKGSTLSRKEEDAFGYVFATFRSNDFMTGLVRPDIKNINFHVYDGLLLKDESLLYEYHQSGSKDHPNEGEIYRHNETIYIAGHPWTFEFVNSYKVIGYEYERILPWIVLIGGVIFSILIFAYINSISTAQNRAVVLAEELTKNLRKNKIELENKNKKYLKKLEELNKLNQFMVDREMQMIKLKNLLAKYNTDEKDTL